MKRVFIATLAGICAGSLACSSAPSDIGSSSEAYTTQCAGAMVVEGVDISAGQAPVDWTSVTAAGRQFAFIKATQGNYYTSSAFASQYAGALSAGVYRSAYHFFDPTVDGVTQANYFLSVASTILPGDLPPMLDIECPDGDATCLGFTGGSGDAPSATIVSRALDWLTTVTTATGKTPIVYTFPAYFPDLATADTGLAAYPLFIATLSNCASVPAPWTMAVFWQYSWTGTVAGIPGQVDLDRFFGSLSDLQTFALSCQGSGGTCTANTDCCSGYVCNGAKQCATCLNAGDACMADADCCGLAVCTASGTCSDNLLPAETTGNRWITAVNWPATGDAELFVRGKDGTLLHSKETSGTWSTPTSLGQPVACGSGASIWLENKTTTTGFGDVFSPGPNGATGLDDSYDQMSQAWAAPVSFDGAGLTEYVSLPWPDGHVEVFALDQVGAVWHRYWDLGTSAWTTWSSMGGTFVSTPTAIIRGDNNAELFSTDSTGQAWHNESGPYPGGWSGFRLLSVETADAGPTGDAGAMPIASRPVPVRWPDGHVEVFAVTPGGDLVSSSRTTSWSPFSTIASGVRGEPSVVISSGAPEVFVRDAQNAVMHTSSTMTGWQPLTPLLTQTSSVDPWAWQWMDGTVEVFAAHDDGQGDATLSHVRRDPSGTWGSWQVLGGPIDVCDAPGVGSDGGPTMPGSSAGCGCTTAGDRSPRGAIFALTALAFAMVRRRARKRMM